MLLDEIYREKEEYLDEIDKMRHMERPIILFGAGSTSDINLHYFRNLGIFPVAFCDNSSEKIGNMVEDVKIVSLEQAKECYPEAYYYITTQLFYGPIKEQLLKNGIEAERISEYDIICQFPWESTCIDYYKKREQEIQSFYEGLGDEFSREVMKGRLLFLRTRNRKYVTSVREKDQYFDRNLIDFKKVKCFVDAGMYIGDTIQSFIETTEGVYDKIYGFEPDEEIRSIAKNNLVDYDNIVVIPKATSDFNGSIQVEKTLGVMQTIEKGIFSENAEADKTFEVCKIDDCLANRTQKIDMLKMDVEGAEMASLRGASEMIKSDRPIMAICVYHKEEDLLDIPAFVEGLGVKCRLYLRHYSDNQTETVCYLIPE